jgi:hypothetical protein
VHPRRGPIDAVPQRANDTGTSRITRLEGDEHLVAHVGNEPAPTVVAGHQHREARLALEVAPDESSAHGSAQPVWHRFW